MSASRRVLFVSYLFPPVGGVSVQRVTKFVKYLPEFGWQSSVLTVSNPSVPLVDDSFNKDIPPGTILRRAKTLEPGYAIKKAVSGGQTKKKGNPVVGALKSVVRSTANMVLQPDAQVLWHHNAYRDGLKLLSETPHDAIVATGPPFSNLVLGDRLSRKTGVPLVLDYRDEWDISNAYWENKGHNQISNWIQTRQQASALKTAKLVLATTPSSAAAIRESATKACSQAECSYIYNGYDPDDFPNNIELTKPDHGNGTDRFRLSFIGTLWNLNSIEPVVRAIQHLAQQKSPLLDVFELLLAGRRTPDQEALLDELNELPVQVVRLPFVNHDEAIRLMRTSDALLMLNSELPKTQRIINAKTFEYMAAKRPMFVVAPEGDVWNLVYDLPGTRLCQPSNIESIAEQLALAIEEYRVGVNYESALWEIQSYHRRELAQQLAHKLEAVVGQNEFPLPAGTEVSR